MFLGQTFTYDKMSEFSWGKKSIYLSLFRIEIQSQKLPKTPKNKYIRKERSKM